MDQNFQTSFIPKKPQAEERAVASRPVGFLTIISIFIFFTVLIASAGLYFYRASVQTRITGMEAALNLAKNRFEVSQITRLQVLDKRLNASSEILNNHIAISPIFAALAKSTLKTVRYTKFTYTYTAGKTATVDVKMSGQGVGYRSIALQGDLLNTNKNITDPVFSNLTLDTKTGNVNFDLEFSVDPTFVDYKQVLATGAQN